MITPRTTACLLAFVLTSALHAQDVQRVRDWENANRTRPTAIQSVSRIAPVKEPGTPLVVHGRIFQRDGVTPAPAVIVFAYQTDATGVYNPRGTRGWRLRGWVKSDAQGRFEFRTIRPGSYSGIRQRLQSV
jgi:protocatechuate 3,4-dioxygenase beta subunit